MRLRASYCRNAEGTLEWKRGNGDRGRKSRRVSLLYTSMCNTYMYVCAKGRSACTTNQTSSHCTLSPFTFYSSHYRARLQARLQFDCAPHYADLSLFTFYLTIVARLIAHPPLASRARFDWPPSTARQTLYRN